MSYEDALQILEHAQPYKVAFCLKRKPPPRTQEDAETMRPDITIVIIILSIIFNYRLLQSFFRDFIDHCFINVYRVRRLNEKRKEEDQK